MALSNSGTIVPRCGKAQFAARVLAAGVVGVLLGQVGKVRARLNLLQNRLGLGLGRGVGLGVGALAAP